MMDPLKMMGSIAPPPPACVPPSAVRAASEGPDNEPWRIAPALQPCPGQYNQEVLDGMDWLIYQLGALSSSCDCDDCCTHAIGTKNDRERTQQRNVARTQRGCAPLPSMAFNASEPPPSLLRRAL